MKGTVGKRGDRYYFRLDLPPVDGVRKQRRQSGFRTRAQAEDALTMAKVAVLQGVDAASSTQLLGAFLDEWLTSIAASVRPTTLDGYQRAVANWIKPRIGRIQLRNLTTQRLQAFYGELGSSGRQDGQGGLGSRSVRLSHQTLHTALQRAVDWHIIPTNPAAGNLSLPRQVKKPPPAWTPEEAKRFLAAVEGDRLAPLWKLMLATGLRRGEALGLRWENVDLEAGTLAVVQTVVVAAGKVITSEPKTSSSRRTIGLHPSVLVALEKHRADQDHSEPTDNYVFRSSTGGSLHPGRTLLQFHEACKRAGVPDLGLHGLRHTAATLALRAGVHPKLVMAMLGHSSIAMTLDLYSHVQPGMAKEATDQIGGLLFGD